MSEAAIREQIAAILGAVEGIGVVHQYQRWSASWNKFLSLFKDDEGKISGCMISRQAVPATRATMPTIERKHKYIMNLIYGLNDSEGSELIFQARVEAIQDAFDSEYTLGGTVLNSGPVQGEIVEARLFGGTLCHYAKLVLEATERVTYNS